MELLFVALSNRGVPMVSRAVIAVAVTESSTSELLVDLLESDGYRVYAYRRPVKATTLALTQHDLIILDLRLVPPVRGWRLLSAIRQHPVLQQTPVLALTIDTELAKQRQAQLDAWRIAVHPLPFDIRDLQAAVRALLSPQAITHPDDRNPSAARGQ
jgi:DNA-binding response OmpR family regulator